MMHVHLVFVAKYPREVFTKEVLDDLRGLFSAVGNDFEAVLVAFHGEDDHVHLLVNYHPEVALSTLVNSLKGVSSRMIRHNKYPSIRKSYGQAPCGLALTSPGVAEALPSPSSATTS
jgi:putative transposase